MINISEIQQMYDKIAKTFGKRSDIVKGLSESLEKQNLSIDKSGKLSGTQNKYEAESAYRQLTALWDDFDVTSESYEKTQAKKAQAATGKGRRAQKPSAAMKKKEFAAKWKLDNMVEEKFDEKYDTLDNYSMIDIYAEYPGLLELPDDEREELYYAYADLANKLNSGYFAKGVHKIWTYQDKLKAYHELERFDALKREYDKKYK